MARGSKIGEAYVEIRADADKLAPELAEAKATVERETAEMGDSVERNVAGKFQDASSKLSGFVGAATGLLGVAAVANRLGDAISRIVMSFVRAGDAARDFRQEARNLDDINGAINDLNDSVTSGGANLLNYYRRFTDFVGLSEEASREAKLAILEEERAIRQKHRAQERANELERERAKLAKEASERAATIEAENRAIEESRLEGIDRINAEEKRKVAEVAAQLASEEDERARMALFNRLNIIAKIADAERQAISERERLEKAADEERQRRAEEAAQRQADALASALTGALDRISSAQRINEAKTLANLSEIKRMLESTALFQGHNGRAR